jgi:hypothetical protein
MPTDQTLNFSDLYLNHFILPKPCCGETQHAECQSITHPHWCLEWDFLPLQLVTLRPDGFIPGPSGRIASRSAHLWEEGGRLEPGAVRHNQSHTFINELCQSWMKCGLNRWPMGSCCIDYKVAITEGRFQKPTWRDNSLADIKSTEPQIHDIFSFTCNTVISAW